MLHIRGGEPLLAQGQLAVQRLAADAQLARRLRHVAARGLQGLVEAGALGHFELAARYLPPTEVQRARHGHKPTVDLVAQAGRDHLSGNGPGTGGCTLHNPHYDFNDAVLETGVRLHIALARHWLR